MMSHPVSIGEYELIEPIGKGGMAVVWRGRHRTLNTPVAIKIMTGGHVLNPQFHSAFENEVRALAGLDHPGIVTLWDSGKITPDMAQISGGRLVADSPYLVMELADRGTLNQAKQPLRWPDLKRLLLSILDALAYAHSRGVIHLDLKPANVLVAGGKDPRTGLKLTDFGLAFVMGHAARPGTLRQHATILDMSEWAGYIPGTPLYMAPEQFESAYRDYGPWTDLYAFGCIAYRLASGVPPFPHENFMQLMYAHIHKAPPPLVPRRPVPDRFETWVLQLLEKRPRSRFQRAADAAWELLALTDPPDNVPFPAIETRNSDGGGLAVGYHEDPLTELQSLVQWVGEPLSGLASLGSPSRLSPQIIVKPLLPASWQRPEGPRSWRALMNSSSIQLYGMRTVPLVGREPERSVLWAALKAVHESARARLLALHGASGTGKSRIVEWIAERAHEVGGAIVLKASHAVADGPTDALSRMLARFFQCAGLKREDVSERISRLLQDQGVTDEYEWHALTEIIFPSANSDIEVSRSDSDALQAFPVIRFRDPNERYVVIRHALERLAKERPVILCLDDVQWGSDSLGFSEYLLRVQSISPSPILMLATVQDEALAERSVESAQLVDILSLPFTQRVEVKPLPLADHLALVLSLLPMEKRLAAQVAERTQGNPLFAVQLVGDWVAREALMLSDRGFALRHGDVAALPNSLHHVWTERIQRLLDGQPPAAAIALELAAILGGEVSTAEWEAVCAAAKIIPPPDLVERLLGQRLVQATTWEMSDRGLVPSGWSFVHGMLRESLARMARDAGRWVHHHLMCAQMLRTLYLTETSAILARLGRHLVEAGSHVAALHPLLRAARSYFKSGDSRLAHSVLNLRDRALNTFNLPEIDPRWGDGWIMRAELYLLQGQLQLAQVTANQALSGANRHHWPEVRAESVKLLAQVLERRGEFVDAEARFEEAQKFFRQLGNKSGIGVCLAGLADCTRERADLTRMAALLRQAQSLYWQCGDLNGQAECLLRLGHHAQMSAELQRASTFYEEALRLFDQIGNQSGRAEALRSIGVVAMNDRSFPLAAEQFKNAMAIYRRIGSQHEVANCLNNLAELDRLRGDMESAVAGYQRAIQLHDAIGSAKGGILPRFNLGLLLMNQERFQDARQALEESLSELERGGRLILIGAVHCCLLPCVAAAQDWSAWDRSFDEVLRYSATGVVEGDDADAVKRGGYLAIEQGEHTRGLSALKLALSIWSTLNHREKSEELKSALRRITGAAVPEAES